MPNSAEKSTGVDNSIDDMVAGHTPRATYDRNPSIDLPRGERIARGDDAWRAAAEVAKNRAGESPARLVVDTYPGVDLEAVRRAIARALPEWRIVDAESAAKPGDVLTAEMQRNLTDDRVFGVMSHATLADFYRPDAVQELAREVADAFENVVLLGWGADLVAEQTGQPAALVLVDMARWEIQQRQRAGQSNWHADNGSEDTLRKYKRGFFIEWRVADRHKRAMFDHLDFVVDGNAISPSDGRDDAAGAGMITGDAFRGALAAATHRPFRVVPFFDPGVWGGQWMKSVIGLAPEKDNYAWCFDCVPEENSLLLTDGENVVELPSLDLVLDQPVGLLGPKTFARFGAEFPIRFDFLDTVEGGNLSLQVHPLTDYIRNRFGMHYTQDESYYLLDAGDDAVVYLGLKDGIDKDAMVRDLRAAQSGGAPFPAEKYVNSFPAKKHDHFLIPAGTVHCSGADSMVLEISATPFIFTFKLWDWGRVGLDGIPRPVHIDHGARNIQWDRDTEWTKNNLVDQVETISESDGVREERTGLHELEFIEVRRHWFDNRAEHDTDGTVNVLNLVEGDEVRVVSPDGAFESFTVHYAETFIVPAAVGRYVIERTENSRSERFGTVKAYVRGTRRSDDAHPVDDSMNHS